jgi:hypothetical protein
MRRCHIWFLIAFFWLIDTILVALRQHVSAAALPAAVTLAFVIVGLIYLRRDRRRDRIR